MFFTFTPGSACDSDSPFKKSSSLIQSRSCTNSRNNQPLSPPPKLVRPMREKIRNRRQEVGLGAMSRLSGCDIRQSEVCRFPWALARATERVEGTKSEERRVGKVGVSTCK